MKNAAKELCDDFRDGRVGRREFLQRLAVTTGSVLAASHVLDAMGFDSGLRIQEKTRGLLESSNRQLFLS